MQTVFSQLHIPSFCLAALFCLVSLPSARGQASAPTAASTPPPGPPKVRLIVKENNLMGTAGGLGGTTATPKPAAQPGNAPVATLPKGAAEEADKYTHTTKKSLEIAVVNLTNASIDVNVKATFLARDEAPGKHEIVPEKTVEKQLTLLPGKPQTYTTEEVGFTHTMSHRPPAKPGTGKGRVPPTTPEPASGHSYTGYKVEVFQGNDLVGSAMSDTH